MYNLLNENDLSVKTETNSHYEFTKRWVASTYLNFYDKYNMIIVFNKSLLSHKQHNVFK